MLASSLAFSQLRRAFREPSGLSYGQSWLAEGLASLLGTADARLASAAGPECTISVVRGR